MIGSTLFPERALTEFERYHHNQKTFPYLPSRALLPPAALAGHDVFFLSATLRPETMYGQTNCWVLPEGEYVAVRAFNKDVYVMSQRSALNLSYQDRLPEVRVGGGVCVRGLHCC